MKNIYKQVFYLALKGIIIIKFNQIPIKIILISIVVVSHFVIAQGNLIESGISFQEFLNERDIISGNFTKYDPGDRIQVVDIIEEIHFRGEDSYETQVWLKSSGSSKNSESLLFVSDLTTDFKEGEKVRITFTIILNQSGSTEDYRYDKDDIEHITYIKEETKDEKGVEFFGYKFSLPNELDNNYGRFLIYFVLWVIIAAIVLIISNIIINRIVKRTKMDISILKIIRKPIFILIVLYGLIISLSALELSEDMLFWFKQAYNIGLFITIIWLVYKILNTILLQLSHRLGKGKKNKMDNVLVPILQKVIGILIFIFAVFTILGYIGIDLTVIAVGGVLISMVIAFAAQDTLSNFFSGIFLAAEADFKEGDLILMDDNAYEVRHVGMRNTKLYDTKEHMLVITPNNIIANNKIVNLSEPDEKLKLFIDIGVAYGTDPNKVKKILLDIAKNQPHVINDRKGFEPVIRFWEFAESSLNFKLIVWLDDVNERFAVRNDINFEIDRRFKEEHVEIPFPQRVVHMKQKD